ncbi:MAG: HD domain-containing protein [Candidatus Woesearchaeota archaeon]
MIQIENLKECIKLIYKEPLPSHIHYHSWNHTQQVEEAGIKIARIEGVNDSDLIRLRSGIYIHDIGNLISRKDHEKRSMNLAYQLLPLFGASDEDLTVIDGIVMATAIPQNPKNHLEKIMCDADFSLMGYEDWIDVIDGYRRELKITDMKKWYENQIGFLSSHKWFTETAASLYDDQKQKNIEVTRQRLKNI